MLIPVRSLCAPLLFLSIALAGSGAVSAAPVPYAFQADQPLPGVGRYQREVAITASPANPSRMVAAFIDFLPAGSNPFSDCRAYYFDGGDRWRIGDPMPVRQAAGADVVLCADPAVAADELGNFYISYLNASFGAVDFPPDVFVAKSTDGGRSFSSFSVALQGVYPGHGADKSWIAADSGPASPYRGNLYVVWSDLWTGAIEMVRSIDRAGSWSTPTPVSVPSTRPLARGVPIPVVGPDGAVTIFWIEETTGKLGTLAILFSRSIDGGVTWSAPAAVASQLASSIFLILKDPNPKYGKDPNAGLGAVMGPAAAAGPDGSLYVAWTDAPDGSCRKIPGSTLFACSNTDVRMSASHDGGRTWSRPVKVNDDSGTADQFLPAVAVHPSGLVSLTWMDRRLDPGNINYNAYYTNTTDGVTFLPNARVSTATSILVAGDDVGDYNTLAAVGTDIFAAWCDDRSTIPGIFVARGAPPR